MTLYGHTYIYYMNVCTNTNTCMHDNEYVCESYIIEANALPGNRNMVRVSPEYIPGHGGVNNVNPGMGFGNNSFGVSQPFMSGSSRGTYDNIRMDVEQNETMVDNVLAMNDGGQGFVMGGNSWNSLSTNVPSGRLNNYVVNPLTNYVLNPIAARHMPMGMVMGNAVNMGMGLGRTTGMGGIGGAARNMNMNMDMSNTYPHTPAMISAEALRIEQVNDGPNQHNIGSATTRMHAAHMNSPTQATTVNRSSSTALVPSPPRANDVSLVSCLHCGQPTPSRFPNCRVCRRLHGHLHLAAGYASNGN